MIDGHWLPECSGAAASARALSPDAGRAQWSAAARAQAPLGCCRARHRQNRPGNTGDCGVAAPVHPGVARGHGRRDPGPGGVCKSSRRKPRCSAFGAASSSRFSSTWRPRPGTSRPRKLCATRVRRRWRWPRRNERPRPTTLRALPRRDGSCRCRRPEGVGSHGQSHASKTYKDEGCISLGRMACPQIPSPSSSLAFHTCGSRRTVCPSYCEECGWEDLHGWCRHSRRRSVHGLALHGWGMHATQDIVYAMEHTTGLWVCRVQLLGKRLDEATQSCAETRIVLWMVNGEQALYQWIVQCYGRASAAEIKAGRAVDPVVEHVMSLLRAQAEMPGIDPMLCYQEEMYDEMHCAPLLIPVLDAMLVGGVRTGSKLSNFPRWFFNSRLWRRQPFPAWHPFLWCVRGRHARQYEAYMHACTTGTAAPVPLAGMQRRGNLASVKGYGYSPLLLVSHVPRRFHLQRGRSCMGSRALCSGCRECCGRRSVATVST